MKGLPGRTIALAVLLVLAPLACGATPRAAEPVAASPPGPSDVAKWGSALRKAKQAWAEQRAKRALKALEPLRSGMLGDHVERIRATWLRELGRLPESAAAARAGLVRSPPTELRAHLQLELAQTQLQAGDLSEAYRAQREAWEASRDEGRRVALMVDFARELEGHELPADALLLYRRAWTEGPVLVTGEAFERDRVLARATGAPSPEPAALLERAERLRDQWQCETALEILSDLSMRGDLPVELASRAEEAQAACLFQTRRYAEATVAYGVLAVRRPDDHELALQHARALGRLGKIEQAVRELRAIARRAPVATGSRARYLAALLLEDGDREAARELLRELEGAKDAPDQARLACWRLAWDDYLAGRYREALARMEPFTAGSRWDIEVQRARYWTAMAKRALGEPEGDARLAALAAEVPLSYYGLLAARRLGAEPELGRSFVGVRSQAAPPLAHLRASVLLRGGFPEAATEELESWISDQRLGRELRLLAAELFRELGDHFRAVRLVEGGFGGTLESGIDPEWRDAWLAAWPEAYDASVRSATAEFSFEPWLVYAVMREESTYRPEVESPAGAIGLMQIIPPTGTRIASDLGVTPFEPALLRQPEINIRFGTYYLNRLLQEFGGAHPLAIAAYNAGPEAVSRWLAKGQASELDAFVDSIPYDETRRYCRRVLRSYWVYQLLYAAGPRPEPPASAEAARPEAQPEKTARR